MTCLVCNIYCSIINTYLIFLFNFNLDQSHSESNLLKIEDLKDWLKCSRKSNQILYDSKLMFKTNFNVKNIFLANYIFKNNFFINCLFIKHRIKFMS